MSLFSRLMHFLFGAAALVSASGMVIYAVITALTPGEGIAGMGAGEKAALLGFFVVFVGGLALAGARWLRIGWRGR